MALRERKLSLLWLFQSIRNWREWPVVRPSLANHHSSCQVTRVDNPFKRASADFLVTFPSVNFRVFRGQSIVLSQPARKPPAIQTSGLLPRSTLNHQLQTLSSLHIREARGVSTGGKRRLDHFLFPKQAFSALLAASTSKAVGSKDSPSHSLVSS